LVMAGVRWVPWRTSQRLGRALGLVVYALAWRLRRRARHNLALALGAEKTESELAAIARQSFAHLGSCFFEIANFERMRGRLDEIVTTEGEQHLSDVLSEGKGFIWVTGHLGNWELCASYFALRGIDITVVARKIRVEELDVLMRGFRDGVGIRTVVRGAPGAGRDILRALRRGGALAVLIDQDTDVQGTFVPFFGRPAYTPTAPAALALRLGCPLMCGFIAREPGGDFRVVIHPPFHVRSTGNHEEDLRALTERLTASLEAHIRRYPEQWTWMHRRWREEA